MAKVQLSRPQNRTLNNDIIYSDIFTNLDAHPNKRDLVRHVNDESVKRSIRNILLTNRGERLFKPLLGSDIRAILFENMSPVTEQNLKTFVETAIQNYEPRAKLRQVLVTGVPDLNAYSVTVAFSTINNNDTIFLEMLLERTR